MRRYLLCAVMAIMIASSSIPSISAQNEAVKEGQVQQAPAVEQAPATPAPAVEQATSAPAPAKEETPKAKELSIYGEVQNVNIQANSITVQYYDYDNDEEKSTEIIIDGNSKLENVKAIGDIKKGDWVDVTYTETAGNNLATIVAVEKEEPAEEAMPDLEE